MQLDLIPNEDRICDFSACRRYRYGLQIIWDDHIPMCQFIGLNPSTADEVQDDPTIRRIKAFCRDWGYGGLFMTNLFAYRATLPEDMKAHPRPIGEFEAYTGFGHTFFQKNDIWLFEASRSCALTVAAWGCDGLFLNRQEQVCKFLKGMKCLGRNADGTPKHPLYLRADTKPQEFN